MTEKNNPSPCGLCPHRPPSQSIHDPSYTITTHPFTFTFKKRLTMADQSLTANPALVTVGDIAESVLTIDEKILPEAVPPRVARIKVIAGTVNFNTVGNAADGAAYAAGESFEVLLVKNQLNFKGAAATDNFQISI